ncbi:thiol-activated cytolysin family protein [Pyxidicoccus trucidator]|uniref:thiol-activated cytolysin family protein n=1 Tax=Pyxidicoccus trucidator TaxID=2709662 RepID=UPI0013DC4E39|nr:thiol-activated cytolysin family protein [Pyxidicoccus trucidator]
MSQVRALLLTGLSIAAIGACGGETGDEFPVSERAPGVAAEEVAETGVRRQGLIQNPALYDTIVNPPALVLPTPSQTSSSTSTDEVKDSTVNICTYTSVSETRHFDKLVSFDPNADTLWPGSLVQAESLKLGLLSPIGGKRAPGRITLTNARIDGSTSPFIYSRDLTTPNLASTQDGIHSILTANTINFAAKVAYTMHQAYSLNEGALKAGFSAQFAGASLASTFGNTWTTSKTTFLVDFTQSYYTVSFETPNDPTAVFDPTVTASELATYISAGNPPGYVASVSYGRRLLVKFESAESSSTLSATLDAAFSKGGAGGSITLDANQQKTLRESKMTVLALGGPAGSAVQVIGSGLDKVTALQNYFQSGANFSPSSPGVPLSYTVRYLKNFQPMVVASATNYTVPSCVGKTNSITVTLGSLQIYADGETIGKGEICYDIFVHTDTGSTLLASGRDVKRGSGDSITLGQQKYLTLLQQDGKAFDVEAKVWESSKHADSKGTHSFVLFSKSWSPAGSRETVGEYKNLKVGLRYTITVN